VFLEEALIILRISLAAVAARRSNIHQVVGDFPSKLF
jgi:hypothetical protein